MKKHLLALGACCALPLWLLCQSIDTQLYTYPNNNASPNRMIRTQDGGYLMVANLFCYTPYSTPIEGCPTGVWIIRVDMAGNTLWSRRHQNFNPGFNNVHIFENPDNTFTLLGSTGGLYTCEGIGIGPFITFSRVTTLRINGANGDILSQEYYADECEFAFNSAVKTATGDILGLGFYNVPIYINSPPPVPMWLHIGPNGSGIDHEFASVAISAGKLLSYDANTVLLFGRNNTGLFSLSSLTPTGQVLNTQSVTTLSNGFAIQEFIKLASGDLAVLLVQNNSQPRSNVLRISPSGQLLDQLLLPYAVTSMMEANNRLLLTSTLTVNNIRDLRVASIDNSWQLQNSTVLDLGSMRENPIQILQGAPNEVTILSNYHFFNQLPVFGPAQIALSKFNPEEVLAFNYAADAIVTAPSPSGSSNGSVEVIVSETGGCSGIYNVSITPITTGGVTPATPLITMYTGYPAGSFLFTGVSAGQYQITVQEAGACGTDPLPLQLIATVTNAGNTSPPVLYLLDFLGQLIADTDPSTPVGDHPNLGPVSISDGNCAYSESFYVYGITADGQLLQTQDFSLQLTPPGGNGSAGLSAVSTGIFQIDVDWPQGSTQLKVTGEDAAGNTASLYLQRNGASGTLPEISINMTPEMLTIPVCANAVTALVTIVIDDPCFPSLNFNNFVVSFGAATGVINFTGNNYREYLVTFLAAGPYLISTSYTNPFGQVAFIDKQVVVTQATANMPPVITTDIDTFTIAQCSGYNVFSFTICDDCAPINIQGVTFNGGGTGLPNINGAGFFFTDNISPNCIYFEVAGNITASGNYHPLITYGSVTLSPTLTVIPASTQLDARRLVENQAGASISQAPLDFEMSVCDTCRIVTERFRMYKSCTTIAPSEIHLEYGNHIIPPSSGNLGNNTYEFTFPICTTDSGLPFRVVYTAPSGDVFTVETTLEVSNFGGDQIAPLVLVPPGPIPLTIYSCASPAVNYWLEPQLLEFCPPAPAVESATPAVPGFQLLQVGEALFLANAQHAGSYEARLQATDASGNIGRDTTVFEVTDAGGGTVPVCVDTVDLAIGAQGWASLSSAQALGGSGTCLSPEDYYVKVLDGDPSNDNRVDGCGEFAYEIYTAQTSPAQGFAGAYSPDHWAVHLHPNASATFTNDLNVNLDAPSAFGAFAITFPADGQLAFDYAYPSSGELTEYQFRLVDANGGVVADWEEAPTGQVQQTVATGQTLIFYFRNDQNNSGETATLSNWAFEPATPDNNLLCTGLVRAYDDLAPVAVTQSPTVQLDDNGLAQLTIDQLDNGSYDNCALASREIRRLYTHDPISCEPITPYYSDWGSTTDFTCCDACQDVLIELRLRDEAGNESVVVTTVEPKEDRLPIIIASDIDPLCCPDPAQCAVSMQYSFTIIDDCTDDPSVFVLFDQNADGVGLLSRSYHRLPNGKYKVNAWTAPIGQHALVIRARDACNNFSERIIPFQVADCTNGYPPIIMLGEGDTGNGQFIMQKNPPLLEQNTPNPFREETQVRFWLPEAGAAVFSIVDINGRVVFQIKNHYEYGWNEITLKAADLPARGLYFYQLEAAGQRLWKKLVRL